LSLEVQLQSYQLEVVAYQVQLVDPLEIHRLEDQALMVAGPCLRRLEQALRQLEKRTRHLGEVQQ
jgi:hypothetical protein